jgi:hypothetical protein
MLGITTCIMSSISLTQAIQNVSSYSCEHDQETVVSGDKAHKKVILKTELKPKLNHNSFRRSKML